MASTFDIELSVAERLLREHKRKFPALEQGSNEARRKWEERGYLILPFGKRTYAKPEDRENRSYAAWNYLIQGSEGVIVQHAMMELDKLGLMIVSQVHDSVYIDVPAGIDPEEVAREAANVLENAAPEKLCTRTNPPIKMLTEAKIIRRYGND